MKAGLYSNNFAQVFSELLEKTGVSCYQISQYTNLDEGYLSRLRKGEKCNPSPETIVKIAMAMARFSDKFYLGDAENLFNSVGRSLTPKRSQRYG
jgi:transcriptional regulator with XRE-family HTH domain